MSKNQKQNPNWPSKQLGEKSGGKRDNNPPKPSAAPKLPPPVKKGK